MIRLVHIVTVGQSLGFLRGQISYLKRCGYDVHVICSPGPLLDAFAAETDVPVTRVQMPRRITPLSDLRAIAGLVQTLIRLRPDVVHSHTPKGGLLGTLSAAIAGVPLRIYHMRGLPMATANGWRRALLATTERVSCGLAHHVLCVSHSLRTYAVHEGLVPARKIGVLLGGSGQGVDAMGRFNRGSYPAGRGEEIRCEMGIPESAPVVLFVGRLVRDKGICELAYAWTGLRRSHPNAHLVIVGPFEERDPVPDDVRSALETDARVHLVGFKRDPAAYYLAANVVTLPSYREGFPNVPLEAASMSLPVVATLVEGCIDAVADGETGMLVPAQDAAALQHALDRYLRDPSLRTRHGFAGRERVLAQFQQERIWAATEVRYRELLAARAIPLDANGGPL